MRFTAIDVAFRGFVQIIVESLPQVRDVPLLDHDLCKVRAPGHAATARFGLCERDVETKFLQAGDQAYIAVAACGLLVDDPASELVQILPAEKIPQQVD